MPATGTYLYGFTDTHFKLDGSLCGIGNAPVRLLNFQDVVAVISDHPVTKLIPTRNNLEPHHKVVRQISLYHPLIPAVFGHISETEEQILDLIRENYTEIHEELDHLAGKVELGIKLRWTVDNIFLYFVRTDRELREFRDRIFRDREPSIDEKIRIGSLFEAKLGAERNRLDALLWTALDPVVCEKKITPPRDEKTICNAAVLIERQRAHEFATALQTASSFFDSNFSLEYSGPWPAYSFVNLHLEAAGVSGSL
jgi:gas vesicle protein GvpL/GvpF